MLQLEQIAGGYPSRERFLTDLTLDPPDATGGQAGVPLKDDDYLILSTIHSAKGQEWRAVFLLNVVDGCIPSDLGTGSSADIEEERRLLYVAMTRAKDQLTLGVPLRFYVTQQARNGDRHLHAMRSRFISRDMLERYDVIYWQPPILADSRIRPPAPQAIDVSARMRGMWPLGRNATGSAFTKACITPDTVSGRRTGTIGIEPPVLWPEPIPIRSDLP